MPLAYIKYQGPNSILGLWHLTEEESFFLPHVDKLVTDKRNLESIHHAKRRTEWLAGRYLVMELAKTINLRFDGIWTDEFNKPHLISNNANISLSHTPPYVVAILDVKSLCGIDVEGFRPKLIPLSPKFLSSKELDIANNDLEVLAVLWGAKEALYKAYGRRELDWLFNFVGESSFSPWRRLSIPLLGDPCSVGDGGVSCGIEFVFIFASFFLL